MINWLRQSSRIRAHRLLVSIILPPPLGLLIVLAALSVSPAFIDSFVMLLPAAYVFMGLQVVLSACAMEMIIRRRVTRKILIVVWTIALG